MTARVEVLTGVGVRAGAVRLAPEVVAAALHPRPAPGGRVHLVEQRLERKAVHVVELRAREPGRERGVVPEEHHPAVVLVQLEPGDPERDQVGRDVPLPDRAAVLERQVRVPTAGLVPGRGAAAAPPARGPCAGSEAAAPPVHRRGDTWHPGRACMHASVATVGTRGFNTTAPMPSAEPSNEIIKGGFGWGPEEHEHDARGQ